MRKADLPSPFFSVLFINWSIKKLYFRSFATGDENAAAYLKMIFILSCCCWKRKKLHDVCLKLPWSSSSSSKNLLLWSFIYNNCCQIQDSFILLLCSGPIQLLLIIYQNYFLPDRRKMHQFKAVHSSILGWWKFHATFHPKQKIR